MYPAGTRAAIIGSGKEENRNNSYPHAAVLAQPSGVCVADELQAAFVADSERSSICKISLTDGRVSAVVGGDRSPFVSPSCCMTHILYLSLLTFYCDTG
jgi:hypothetical protein